MIKRLRIYWRHGADVMRRQGFGALLRLVQRRMNRLTGRYRPGQYDFSYPRWLQQTGHLLTGANTPTGSPRFSILVPVYNTRADLLHQTLGSVTAQRYPDWQCILVNDGSTKDHVAPLLDQFAASDSRFLVKHCSENAGIAAASAAGLELADGDFIVLLDHDDLLAPDALIEAALVLDRAPDADLIYSDEDKVDLNGTHSAPFFKPDFSPTLLLGQNYVSHLLILKRSLAIEAGSFRPGFDGAQDYDMILRASHLAQSIHHIPRVLYHWRQVPGSTALAIGEKGYAAEAGLRALQSHLDSVVPGATATHGEMAGTYRTKYPVADTPKVSVIIPFRDQPGMLDRCLTALFAHTDWQHLEVLCVNNDSTDPAIASLEQRWQRDNPAVRFMMAPGSFNFSRICNDAVVQSSGEYVVLLNNDVTITSDGWIETLLGHAQQEPVGAVGGLLSYPGGRVQHAGIVVGIGDTAGHPFKGFGSDQIGYFGRLRIASNVSAVTGALLMVRRALWDQAGGLDADHLGIALNDVDFCLKLQDAGYLNVVEPACRGVHEESLSRGSDDDPARRQRWRQEADAFCGRWQSELAQGDPFYNPNLTLDAEDYSLNWRLATSAGNPNRR